MFQVLSDRGAGKLPQYIVTLGAQDWDSARLIFLLFLVFPFNALITVGIYRKNFFLVFVTVFLLFFPAMIYAITPPLWCLALIAASLGAAAVLSSLPKQLKKGNTFRAMLKNGICISLAALICFSGISVFYTTDFFQNDSLNNLRQVFSQLDFLYNSESSSMPASPVGSASSVDLSGEEGPVFTGETILRVKTNASHNLFLKAQSLEDYERDHWESNDSSINTSIDNSQLFTSLYLSTLRQSVESYEEPLPPLDKSLANFSSTMYSVEVEPVASNLQKMYLPYGFIERPWDVVSSAFFIGDSSVTPMSSRQENYTFSAYEVELSMLKNTPYWTERNLGQRDDEAYSGTHPFRRLSLQDYYLTSAGSYSAQYEDGYHFCSVESSYRNAYYERYTCLLYTS